MCKFADGKDLGRQALMEKRRKEVSSGGQTSAGKFPFFTSSIVGAYVRVP